MSCNLCKKGVNIIIENYTKDFLSEAVATNINQKDYVLSIIKSVEKYPPLKQELNNAFEQVAAEVEEQAIRDPRDVLKVFKSSVKKYAESGFSKVIGDGKNFTYFLLNENKQKMQKLPGNLSKDNIIQANESMVDLLDKSWAGVVWSQLYVDYLFRQALPSELSINVLLPLASKAVKSKGTLEENKTLINEIFPDDISPSPEELESMQKHGFGFGGLSEIITRDAIHLVLDIVGTIDPWGIADGTNVALYIQDYVNALDEILEEDVIKKQKEAAMGALGSFVGMIIPYAGDIIKWGIKAGAKSIKLASDLVPLVKKLTQKAASSKGITKRFYEDVLKLLKGGPEEITQTIQKARNLSPKKIISKAVDRAGRSLESFITKGLQKVTLKSSIFQLSVFALLKTETFAKVGGLLFALPVVVGEALLDHFIKFVSTTTIETWKADLEKQEWLQPHPALKQAISEFLGSETLLRLFQQEQKKSEEDPVANRNRYGYTNKQLEENNTLNEKHVRIAIKKNLNEGARVRAAIEAGIEFAGKAKDAWSALFKQAAETGLRTAGTGERIYVKEAMNEFIELVKGGRFNYKGLLSEADEVYKLYYKAIQSIKDSLTGIIPGNLVKNPQLKTEIKNFLDAVSLTLIQRINTLTKSIERMEALKATMEQKGDVYVIKSGEKGAGKQVEIRRFEDHFAELKREKEGLEIRKKEVDDLKRQADVPERSTRNTEVGKVKPPEPPISLRIRTTVFVGTLAAFYSFGYIACKGLANITFFMLILHWIRENILSETFFNLLSHAAVGLGPAWLAGSFAQAKNLFEKITMGAKYIFRSMAGTAGCWDGALTTLAKDIQTVFEKTGFIERYNAMATRLATVQKLNQAQVDSMLMQLHQEGWWANIKEALTPGWSITRGSIADSLINDFSSDTVITDFIAPYFIDLWNPTNIPAHILKDLRKTYFIPSNFLHFISNLSNLLMRHKVTDIEIQRQIIGCVCEEFIDNTLKDSKKSFDKEEFKRELLALYLFFLGEKLPPGAAEADYDTAIKALKTKISYNLERAFKGFSRQVYKFRNSQTAKEIEKHLPMFRNSEAEKILFSIEEFFNETSSSTKSQNYDKFIKDFEENENKIKQRLEFYQKEVERSSGPGQRQYNEAHVLYYTRILTKTTQIKEKIKAAHDNGEIDNLTIEQLALPKTLTSRVIDCKKLDTLNSKLYQELSFVLFNKAIPPEMAQPAPAVSPPAAPTPTGPPAAPTPTTPHKRGQGIDF